MGSSGEFAGVPTQVRCEGESSRARLFPEALSPTAEWAEASTPLPDASSSVVWMVGDGALSPRLGKGHWEVPSLQVSGGSYSPPRHS